MVISFQLYSARNSGAPEDFIPTLAALGYTAVEGYAAGFQRPDALGAALKEHGLTMPTAHIGLDTLDDDIRHWTQIARSLGVRTIFVPFLAQGERPGDFAGYRDFAARLSALGKTLEGEGIALGWHNHDFELVPLADGTVPLDVILSEARDILWQGDLGWVVRANADPAKWIKTFGHKLAAVHVKDLAAEGQNLSEDGWADLGQGVIDWPSLWQQVMSENPDALPVMEHDNPSDAVRFAAASITAFKAIQGQLA